jgi:hypothetical protein
VKNQTEEQQKAQGVLDKIDFSKAPTLGPVYKQLMQAYIDKNWGKVWDLSASSTNKQYEDMLTEAKGKSVDDLKKEKSDMEKNMALLPDEQKKMMEPAMKMLDKQIADCDKIKGMDARAYFIYLMENPPSTPEGTASKTQPDPEKQKIEILGETINGDAGTITEKVDNKENKVDFVKEGGAWKFIIKE